MPEMDKSSQAIIIRQDYIRIVPDRGAAPKTKRPEPHPDTDDPERIARVDLYRQRVAIALNPFTGQPMEKYCPEDLLELAEVLTKEGRMRIIQNSNTEQNEPPP